MAPDSPPPEPADDELKDFVAHHLGPDSNDLVEESIRDVRTMWVRLYQIATSLRHRDREEPADPLPR
jgi:hypothetical protein